MMEMGMGIGSMKMKNRMRTTYSNSSTILYTSKTSLRDAEDGKWDGKTLLKL